MRIAITHPYSWPDVRRGAERIIVESSRALAARGHDVTVLTSGGAASKTVQDGVRTIRFRRVVELGTKHEAWFGARVLPALIAGRYDVVHSFMPWDGVSSLRASRLTRHRTVYEEMGNPIKRRIVLRRDGKARERLIRDVDVFACMSEFSRGHLRRDFGREGTIIPGGVRFADFEPRPRHDRPTILFSGAVDKPEKHVAELLAAVAVLAGARPDVRLLLWGPGDAGPLLAAAPAAVRDRTEVLPLGDPDAIAEQYARAWTTCLPTKLDSFGLVVIESLAAGTPVTAGPEGAPRELVEPTIGAVAASLEPDDLAAALDHSLGLAEQPGTVDACRAVARRYDWDEGIAPILERLYESSERL